MSYGYSDVRTFAYGGVTSDVSLSKSTQIQKHGLLFGVNRGTPDGLAVGGELEARYDKIKAPNITNTSNDSKLLFVPKLTLYANPDAEGFAANASAGVKVAMGAVSGTEFKGLEAKANLDYKGIWMASHCASQNNRQFFLGATTSYDSYKSYNADKTLTSDNILKAGVHAGLRQDGSELSFEGGYQVQNLAFKKPEPYAGVKLRLTLGNSN